MVFNHVPAINIK